MTENLPNLDDYGLKKTFLDTLDGCEGKIDLACRGLGIKVADIETLMASDEIFEEAVNQITFEHSNASIETKCSPTRVIGIRPHDLHHIINNRLQGLPEPTFMHYNTSVLMCRFLGFYRGLSWDTKAACELAKVSSAQIAGWRSRYSEFNELMEAAERDAVSEVYDMAVRRALDPTSSGDPMRSLILKGKGRVIGFDTRESNSVTVNVQRTPQESDAITDAYRKSIEATENIITIEST